VLPSRCSGDDRQTWSDDRRAVLSSTVRGLPISPHLLKGNTMKNYGFELLSALYCAAMLFTAVLMMGGLS
jgi:hypothetical protein